MVLFFLFFLIIIIKEIKGKSEEYYNCINPNKRVKSSSDCTSIIIPDSEGYKCCSMKILYEERNDYNCFPLEKKYIKTKEVFDEYISKRSLAIFFSTLGGIIEIDCGENMKISKNYEAFSDEYINCYKGHIYGAKNERDCVENDISLEEKSKCCFIETSKLKNNRKIIDKRCYFIKDDYFMEEKNLKDYLLDELNMESLDQIKDINVAINCKNYDNFTFKSFDKPSKEKDNESSSGIKVWIIVAIVIVIFIFLLLAGLIIFLKIRKKKNNIEKENRR